MGSLEDIVSNTGIAPEVVVGSLIAGSTGRAGLLTGSLEDIASNAGIAPEVVVGSLKGIAVSTGNHG